MPICQICNLREATLFITRTVNGQKSQISVCRQCAAESGIVKIDLNNLLAGLAAFAPQEDEAEEEAALQCPTCGMTLEEFDESIIIQLFVQGAHFRRRIQEIFCADLAGAEAAEAGLEHDADHYLDFLEGEKLLYPPPQGDAFSD